MNEETTKIQKEIDSLKKSQGGYADILHTHNGFDSNRISYTNLSDRKIWVHHTIYGTDAATATNYGVFFIAPVACVVTKFKEVHQTAGNDASAVTLMLEKLTGTEAPDAGDNVLSATLSLKATANTVQTGSLSSTLGFRSLVAGDRLCLEDTGTLTAVANVTVVVELQII